MGIHFRSALRDEVTMLAKDNRKILISWAVLVAITLLSWAIGANNGHTPFSRNEVITWSVLFIAAIKVRVIMRSFMEVEHAPKWLTRLTDLWLVAASGLLLAAYSFRWALAI
jgi:hypothetical protein